MQESTRSFGLLLAAWRTQTQLGQQDLVDALEPSFREAGVEHLSAKTYGNLEREDRFPRLEELFPLLHGYAMLFEEYGSPLSARDALTYLELAQAKLKNSKRGRHITRERWQQLLDQVYELFHIESDPQEDNEEDERQKRKLAEVERRKALTQLEQDTSHIIGRGEYCEHLVSFVQDRQPPRKKVIAVTGMTGLGKTSVFKVLQKQLLALPQQVEVINCELQGSDTSNTPRDWFDRVIAQIYNRLQPKQNEIAALPTAEKQIQRTLQAIAAHNEPLIILVDDAQRLVETSGTWCEEWKQFLHAFLQSEHQATLYISSREWPIWQDREGIYLVHEDVPTLPLESAVKIWQSLGFANEDQATLQKAAELCGYNPRMMELAAQKINLPDVSFDWESSWDSFDTEEKASGLARFITNPHIAGAVPLLEDIIGRTVSEEAKKLLKVLALAPVPLPPPLVLRISPSAKQHIHELIRASLLAKRPDRLVLLPLVAEAVIEYATREEKEQLAQALTDAYNYWLQAGKFNNEAEQALVVAELLVLYLQQHQLMDAAQLLISSGWLAYQFGHGVRLARICQDALKECNWRQSPDMELAANLLDDRLAAFRGEKITTAEKARRYQALYQRAQESGITLSPSTIVHLLQPIILHLSDIAQFQEAEALVDSHIAQMSQLQAKDPLTFSSFLYCRAYLLAKWGESEIEQEKQSTGIEDEPEFSQGKARIARAVNLFWECVALLKESERGASPLQKSRAIYKRARRLHNFAYYSRMLNLSPSLIESALLESISLKKRGYTTPGSLAIAYAEYALYLASLGQFREAFQQSDLALKEAKCFVETGNAGAPREYAVLQVERAELHLLVGDVSEADALFTEAKACLEKETRRREYLRKAEAGLQTIATIRHSFLNSTITNHTIQLDTRWFPRYQAIADYDTLAWLTQSGPFTLEEQEQWDDLVAKGKVSGLKQLMQNALQRELDTALAEKRNPVITYPAIPMVLVRQKIQDCLHLKKEISTEEPNTIVKRLYDQMLQDLIDTLCYIEAIHMQDAEAFDQYSSAIFEKPSPQDMQVALIELSKFLSHGMQHDHTRQQCQHIIEALQYAGHAVVPDQEEITLPIQQKLTPLLQQLFKEQRVIPFSRAAKFLEEQILSYGFTDWKVRTEKNAVNAFVEANTKELVLPARDITPKRLQGLLAHEVESHILRHFNGAHSKLAILGYGLPGSSPIEEAIAVHNTAIAQGEKIGISWLGTVAVCLAAGISASPDRQVTPLGFYELFLVLRDYYEVDQLLQGKEIEVAKQNAARFAQRRCLRVWRGVPNNSPLGVCSTKDNVYLHGALLLEDFLRDNHFEAIPQELLVGCIGLNHLDDCRELGIVKPFIEHKALAQRDEIIEKILDLV